MAKDLIPPPSPAGRPDPDGRDASADARARRAGRAGAGPPVGAPAPGGPLRRGARGRRERAAARRGDRRGRSPGGAGPRGRGRRRQAGACPPLPVPLALRLRAGRPHRRRPGGGRPRVRRRRRRAGRGRLRRLVDLASRVQRRRGRGARDRRARGAEVPARERRADRRGSGRAAADRRPAAVRRAAHLAERRQHPALRGREGRDVHAARARSARVDQRRQAVDGAPLLLRREALELALYTFRYVKGVDLVVALLPPKPPASNGSTTPTQAEEPTQALFYRPGDLDSSSTARCGDDPAEDPAPADDRRPREAAPDRATDPHEPFKASFEQGQDTRVFLVLDHLTGADQERMGGGRTRRCAASDPPARARAARAPRDARSRAA